MRFSVALVHGLGLSCLEWVDTARADSYESALLDGVTARDHALQTGEAQDWRRAVAHLDRALQYRLTPEALFERARALDALGRGADAANDFERARDLGLPPRPAEHARRYVTEHEAELGRLLLRGPDGAAASIAGRPPIELPLVRPVPVSSGSVGVRVDTPTCLPWLATIAVTAGAVVSREVACVPLRDLTQPVRPPGPSITWDRVARVAGTGLAAAGGLTTLAAELLLRDARRDLAASCLELTGDRCHRTVDTDRQDAQAAADRLETLKAVRWLGIGALLGGGLVVGLGTLFAARPPPTAPFFEIGWAPHGPGRQLLASLRGHL